jgi:predicted SAM-dependent methyltransferase
MKEVKVTKDNRVMLNIACGSRTHPEWNNVDFSPIVFFVRHLKLTKILRKVNLISKDRFQRVLSIDPGIIHHNFLKGIPWDDNTFDVIYHSHFLEHLDRHHAKDFLAECYRCLKKGGTLRVVIPDLSRLINDYNITYEFMEERGDSYLDKHKESVYNLFYQMVDMQLSGAKQQGKLTSFFENIFRGNTLKAGEAHLWMYDKYTLKSLLSESGFKEIELKQPNSSNIVNWNSFLLDINSDGSVYKEESLYMEATK